jgi:hypothetical protein
MLIPDQDKTPTQVIMCELIRFLALKLRAHDNGSKPKVAVIVSAWDRLDSEIAARGPFAYLRSEFPLFAGRLQGEERLDVQIFGVSVVGGDFVDENFRREYLRNDTTKSGFVVTETIDGPRVVNDLSLPMAWLINGQQD